jgi:hypothetical protein
VYRGRARPAWAVARAAEGLPLLIEDLLSAEGTGPPRRFADSVRARAGRLGPGRLGAIQSAALLGEGVDWDVVREAVGPNGDGALEAGTGLGLLVVEAGGVLGATQMCPVESDMATHKIGP